MVVGGLAAIGAGLWMWRSLELAGPAAVSLEARPQGIMGTGCHLVAIAAEKHAARAALDGAEAALRRVDALTGTGVESSPVSRLNSAGADVEVGLPPDVVSLLHFARRAFSESDGALDVTTVPLVELWRTSGEHLRFPGSDEIARARAASSWEDFHLSETGAIKAQDSARVDLDRLARGYGIDQAVAAMKSAGASACLVDVGGDVRVFGTPPKGSVWELPVPSPFAASAPLLSLRINQGAVCTHGDRTPDAGGDLAASIIDPRTGKPGIMSRASTAVANDALTASAWATVLYIQGPVGIGLLPAGVDGLVVAGKGEDSKVWATPAVAEATSDPSMRRTLQVLGRSQRPGPQP